MARGPGMASVSPPRHFIGGGWSDPSSPGTIEVENPSTGEVIGAVAAGVAADVDAAVCAAREAMAAARHRKWSAEARQEALLALSMAIEADAEAFAQIETLDTGKPISNTRHMDVPATIKALRYFAGWATKITGETMEMSTPGNWSGYVRRVPVGVTGLIVPWNFPLMSAACKIAAAVAAGCAVVLKPAEQSSLSALRLAELTERCGFPPGFVNVVTGFGAQAGAALVDHPDVAKISFTGSTATGTQIAERCGRQVKRCTLELGGKSPVVVMDDADLDAAARAIAASIFFNSGQSCSAGSRLFVHASVAAELVAKIAGIGATMRIGPADDPATQLGPLISRAQRERVTGFIDGAFHAGARLAAGGRCPDGPGYFMEPTILTGVEPGMTAVREEIFGPVLCVMPFETADLDEIAALANQTQYGLAAYVWSRTLPTALGLIDRIEAGTVRVNAGAGNDFSMPVGGTKLSGWGRENGRSGVEAYTELKSVTMAY